MSLQTQIAFIYAILSAKKVKTLFLSFSFFCGYFGNDRNGDNLDLGDLFYQMKKGAGAGLAIESMVHTVGRLDYISPVARQMDLEDIDADDLAGLIGRLLAESDYEAIVVDLPPRPSFLRAVCHLTSQLFCLKHEGEVYDNSAARLVSHIQDASKDQVTTITEIVVADRTEARMLDVDNTEEILNSRLADFVKREMWKKHDRL